MKKSPQLDKKIKRKTRNLINKKPLKLDKKMKKKMDYLLFYNIAL